SFRAKHSRKNSSIPETSNHCAHITINTTSQFSKILNFFRALSTKNNSKSLISDFIQLIYKSLTTKSIPLNNSILRTTNSFLHNIFKHFPTQSFKSFWVLFKELVNQCLSPFHISFTNVTNNSISYHSKLTFLISPK